MKKSHFYINILFLIACIAIIVLSGYFTFSKKYDYEYPMIARILFFFAIIMMLIRTILLSISSILSYLAEKMMEKVKELEEGILIKCNKFFHVAIASYYYMRCMNYIKDEQNPIFQDLFCSNDYEKIITSYHILLNWKDDGKFNPKSNEEIEKIIHYGMLVKACHNHHIEVEKLERKESFKFEYN